MGEVLNQAASPRKVCDENESRIIRKNDTHVKVLFMEEAFYNAQTKNWWKRSARAAGIQ